MKGKFEMNSMDVHSLDVQMARGLDAPFRPLRALGAMAMAAVVTTGCASLVSRPAEEVVAERAQARIEALRRGDYKTAISYHSPAYQEAFGTEELASRFAGARRWISAEVDSVLCARSADLVSGGAAGAGGDTDGEGQPGEVDLCKVTIMVEYSNPRFRMKNRRPLEEKWLLEDGRWYAARP